MKNKHLPVALWVALSLILLASCQYNLEALLGSGIYGKISETSTPVLAAGQVPENITSNAQSNEYDPAAALYNGIQLAWFYKPPADGNLNTIADHFDVFILTKNDEKVRDSLNSLGVTTPFLQYLRFDAIQDRGSCSKRPAGNQVAYEEGDFCWIDSRYPDWFLLDTAGRRIAKEDYYFMDPGSQGWRDFWLQRASLSQEMWGWDGVFLDNVEASLAKRESLGPLPAAYPDDVSYQQASESFLQYLYLTYFKPQGRPLYANIVALREPEVWLRYMQYLDGAMLEAFAVGWNEDYLSPEEWEEQMVMVEKTQSLGKSVILVAQGEQDDLQREQFALASYLLVNNGLASFRYAHYRDYNKTWLYDNYWLDLGKPLAPRYQQGKVWKRDFANGVVTVDPAGHTSSIEMK